MIVPEGFYDITLFNALSIVIASIALYVSCKKFRKETEAQRDNLEIAKEAVNLQSDSIEQAKEKDRLNALPNLHAKFSTAANRISLEITIKDNYCFLTKYEVEGEDIKPKRDFFDRKRLDEGQIHKFSFDVKDGITTGRADYTATFYYLDKNDRKYYSKISRGTDMSQPKLIRD
jgi:hypothetical protein